MPNEILRKQGTTISWLASGGDEVLTLTSLANGAGRKGDTHDWAAAFPPRVIIELETVFAVAPTAGNTLDVYWVSSRDNSNFDGGIAQGDAVFSDEDALRQAHLVGVLPADDDTDTQIVSWIFDLPGRYGFPVVFNNSGQALSGTAGDHALKITPLIDEIQ
jgi:hypothetical protein